MLSNHLIIINPRSLRIVNCHNKLAIIRARSQKQQTEKHYANALTIAMNYSLLTSDILWELSLAVKFIYLLNSALHID